MSIRISLTGKEYVVGKDKERDGYEVEMKEDIHLKRFFEVIEERKNKIWTIKELLERINIMMPSNIELSEPKLVNMILAQTRYRVFRNVSSVGGKKKTYYIFRMCVPYEGV